MKITLLITTFNRGDLLRRSLERLCVLTLPDELLVVDDGSDDCTEEVCRSFEDRLPIRYIYNHNPEWSICSMSRNIGIKQSRNDWIACAEPELFFITDVLAQFAALVPEHPKEVISAGKIYFAPEDNPTVDTTGLETVGDYVPPSGFDKAVGWVAPFTALYYRPWLLDVGGWDEGFPGPWGWDDVDLLTRLRIKGINQHIALDVRALHQWHGPKHRGDVNFENEKYFRAKSFVVSGEENPDMEDVVANEGRQWGQITPRS